MPGLSDSGQPDDIRIHLEQILDADKAHAAAPEGESPQDALFRRSLLLPAALRARVEAALAQMQQSAPGLSAAEVAKLTATRAGRDALSVGQEALARVDSHLQSVTGQRNPDLGRVYGVYGTNPESFAAVYRALGQSLTENGRVNALAQGSPESALAFTPVIASEVSAAHDRLGAILGERVATRAELSRAVALKGDLVSEAQAAISAARNHLYANLPLRKKDPDLRDYGFRPLRRRGRSGAVDDERDDDAENESSGAAAS